MRLYEDAFTAMDYLATEEAAIQESIENMAKEGDVDAKAMEFAEKCKKEIAEAYLRLNETAKFFASYYENTFKPPFSWRNLPEGM